MTYIVHEFDTNPNAQNELLWPAARESSGLTAGASYDTAATTRAVVITADVDGRVSLGGVAATVAHNPVIALTENIFLFPSPAVRTLKFL